MLGTPGGFAACAASSATVMAGCTLRRTTLDVEEEEEGASVKSVDDDDVRLLSGSKPWSCRPAPPRWSKVESLSLSREDELLEGRRRGGAPAERGRRVGRETVGTCASDLVEPSVRTVAGSCSERSPPTSASVSASIESSKAGAGRPRGPERGRGPSGGGGRTHRCRDEDDLDAALVKVDEGPLDAVADVGERTAGPPLADPQVGRACSGRASAAVAGE